MKLNQEQGYRENSLFKSKKVFTTLFLIAVNAIFFALEIRQGGSENIATLYELGALVPEDVLRGQWWRLITANFLHYGWMHFGMNMFGLFIVGRFVETILGISRYLIVYLASGIGTMGIYTLIYLQAGSTQQILVGASAAIMGLVGCIFAVFLKDFYRNRSRITSRRLQSIILIVFIQFIFDFTTPEVSVLSHVLGLTIGFITGFILLMITHKNR